MIFSRITHFKIYLTDHKSDCFEVGRKKNELLSRLHFSIAFSRGLNKK